MLGTAIKKLAQAFTGKIETGPMTLEQYVDATVHEVVKVHRSHYYHSGIRGMPIKLRKDFMSRDVVEQDIRKTARDMSVAKRLDADAALLDTCNGVRALYLVPGPLPEVQLPVKSENVIKLRYN